MKHLGRIPIRHRRSVNEARRKVLMLARLLTRDDVTSARLATATSEMCRVMSTIGNGAVIILDLDEQVPPALSMDFENDGPLSPPSGFSQFFDRVEERPSGNGRHLVRARKAVPSLASVPQSMIEEARQLISQKSRDELMSEVTEKNRELEESLENLRTTRSAKERMEGELNVGRDIQMSMVPARFPPFPDRKEFSIFATLQPAREVGGDFYDFFFLDNDHLCCTIGDVAGKGVPSALFMAMTRTLIKSTARSDSSPASILTHVNDELSENNDSCMFVTVFTGIVNVRTGRFVYTNAGHNPPYLRRKDGSIERLDRRHGPIIGAVGGTTYQEDELDLGAGDDLYLYTDGVTEAMNPKQELYSENRLADLVRAGSLPSMEAAVESVVRSVKEFEAGAEQADDITVLTFRYEGPGEEHRLEIPLQNELAEIGRVNQVFNEFAGKHDLPSGVRSKVNIVLDEVLNNTISYAFKDDGPHEITVAVELSDARLVLVISDDGVPFNPFAMQAPDTSLSLEERQVGGLGIHIVQKVMDKSTYERRVGRNVVTLVKTL